MNNEESKLWYFVDDIECGVLISTAPKDQPAKKLFPDTPTLTFICKDSYDATEIAKLILDRQAGVPYEICDTVIEVKQVFYSDIRSDEEHKLKVL